MTQCHQSLNRRCQSRAEQRVHAAGGRARWEPRGGCPGVGEGGASAALALQPSARRWFLWARAATEAFRRSKTVKTQWHRRQGKDRGRRTGDLSNSTCALTARRVDAVVWCGNQALCLTLPILFSLLFCFGLNEHHPQIYAFRLPFLLPLSSGATPASLESFVLFSQLQSPALKIGGARAKPGSSL